MKKIIVLLMFIPLFVFADAAAPLIDPFVGIVINSEGAHFYEYDSEVNDYIQTDRYIEYGKKIAIYDEYLDYYEVHPYEGNNGGLVLKDDIKDTHESYYAFRNLPEPIKNENNTHTITIVCAISAVICLVIAVIIIKYLNKKSNNKIN